MYEIFSLFVRHLSTIGRDRRYVDRLCLLVQRLHREQEGRSFALALGLEPKLSSMKLHEVLAKHQSQTGAFLVLRPVGREMRVLFQELVLILFLDALAGIFHANGYEIPRRSVRIR